MSKVFGIGMHKTGTSSLGRALELLGYRSCMGANALRANLGEEKMMNSLFAGNYDEIFEFADNYSAFNDLPWCLLYKELDSHFPNSQFILTIRDEKDWLQSCIKYFKNTSSVFRLWVYGVPNPLNNEKVFLDRYLKHNKEVINYFKGRKNFLVLDINDEDKWNKVSFFLKKTKPSVSFPHINKNH